METLTRASLFAAILLLAPALLALPQGPALEIPVEDSAQRYIVAFHDLEAAELSDDAWNGHELVRVNEALGTALVRTSNPALLQLQAHQDPNVDYVEWDDPAKFVTLATPDDPRYPEQYAFPQINAPGAWDTTLGEASVKVGVIDTGIDQDHPDLQGVIAGQRDFSNNDAVANDACGHGTHVAGTIAANTDNARGVAGTAQVSLLIGKALTNTLLVQCTGSTSDIADAITWATDEGADIISMSIGTSSSSSTMRSAVAYAWDQGVLLVAAAGNDGPCSDCISYPAAYPEVMAVTCTEEGETQCRFSSDGPESEIAAPGDDVLSTYNDGGYRELSGTSMSAPHVSGVAALVLSVNASLTHQELRELLTRTAQDLGEEGWDERFGHGELDAAAAVQAAGGSGGGDDGGDGGGGDNGTTNEAPTAAFTTDCTELECTFDGSGSSDADGAIESYAWELGDGATPTGEMITHAYSEGGTYTVTLTVTDDHGATGETSQDVTVTEPPGDAPLFAANFDDGTTDGFSTSGLWHVDDACAAAPSSPNYLGYHRASACDYDTGSTTIGAAAFSVDLSTVSSAQLVFDHRWETESNACGLLSCSQYDTMAVQVSTDGGSSWSVLAEWTSLDDNQLDWATESLPLDSFTGQPVTVRFLFDSVDNVDNDQQGWFVDNVVVE